MQHFALFLRLASQNLLRRPTRTALLIIAVALASGAIFASFVIGRGIQASMERSFSQMGADLIVVPPDAMVNITSALLTVQPTDATLDTSLAEKIAKLDGIEQVAVQSIYQMPMMIHMPEHKANLIVFNKKDDFTILPWLKEKLARPMRKGDLIAGAARTETLGEELEPCAESATVYGRLGRSGVGPLDDSLFTTAETAEMLAHGKMGKVQAIPTYNSNHCSAILVRLAFGTTPEQARFAISQLQNVKIVNGTTIVTSTRQTVSALLTGMLGFAVVVLLGSLLLIGLLFSAIISERKREIGLLSGIGARRNSIVTMLLTEAGFTTALGGLTGVVLGVALLLIFQRSLVYYLETLHIEFMWCTPEEMAGAALACASLAVAGGLIGALIPALQVTSEEPYNLIQGVGQ